MSRRYLSLPIGLIGILITCHALTAAEKSLGPPGTAFFTLPPCRLIDTRTANAPALTSGETRVFTAVGSCGIPPNAIGLAVNLLADAPPSSGEVFLFAGDATPPPVSALVFFAHKIRADNDIVRISDDGAGTIALMNSSPGSANFVMDVFGYFACTSVITLSPAGPALPAGTTGAAYSQTFTASGGSGSYDFTVASGAVPPGLTPSIGGVLSGTPTAGGDFSFTIKATDTSGGCAGFQAYTLHVDCGSVPVSITPAPAQVCAGSIGNTASATGGMTTYSWLITNGTITSSTSIQTITYTAGGSGTVDLTVNVTDSSSCPGQAMTSVPINSVPLTPTITPTPAQVCAGSTGNTADGPAGATSYAWTIANGSITSDPTAQTITYTAGSSGSVTLGLTVTNAAACAATNSIGVTINANPDPPIIAVANPQTFTVSGGSGTFTLTFQGQTTAPLAFDATPADIQTALNALSTIGGVSGTATVTQPGGVFSVAFGGTLTGPQPQMTALGSGGCTVAVSDPTVCADSTGNLASGPAGATTYAWSIINGSITSDPTLQTITYTAGTTGVTHVDLTVTNASSCSAANGLDLTINDSPTTPTITPSPAQVCGNSTGNTADGPAGATTYAWSIINGSITSATNIQTITYTAGASGVVTLNLTVTNASNCSASNSLDVTINAAPSTPTITPSPTQVCAGSTGNTASGPAGATTYAWTISNGSITGGATSQTVTYTAGVSGNVGLTLVVTNAQSCSASKYIKVPINAIPAFTPGSGALPTATYGISYPLTFVGTSGTAPYTFVIASGALPAGMTLNSDGSVSPNTPLATGPFGFSITVTDANGCSSTQSYTLSVQPSLSPDAYSGVGNTELYITGFAGAPSTPAVSSAAGVLANDSPPGIAVTPGTSACVGLGGSLTIDSGGLFLYTPPVNSTGLDTCSYTGTSNGISTIGTVMITLVDRVWYVNDVTGSDSGTRGRSEEPLSSIDQAVANASPNDYIFVHYTGTDYTGSTLNKDGLTLWGQGTTFTLDNLTIVGSTNPTLDSTLTLAANNLTVSSLDVSTGATTGVTNVGTLTGLTIKNNVNVTTTTGGAVLLSDVDSTSGAPPSTGINFFSVSSNGADNGISLQNVNTSSGSFTVLGDGANNASGGTIQGGTSGVALSNAKNVLLSSLRILNTTRSGINGTGVTNFAFIRGTINSTGSQNFDANIAFNTTDFSGAQTQNGNNIRGTLVVRGSTLRNGFAAGLDVQSDAGTILDADISNNTVSNTGAGTAGISILGGGNASTSFRLRKATIGQNTVDNFAGLGILVSVANLDPTGPGAVAGVPSDGTQLITIQNNNVMPKASGGSAIVVASSGGNSASRGQANFKIQCNGNATAPCNAAGALNSSAKDTVISVTNSGYADMTATVDSNVVAANHIAGNGNGIGGGTSAGGAGSASTPGLTLSVSNNTVSGTEGSGILFTGQGATGVFDLQVANNSVSAPVNTGGAARQGIRVDAGSAASVDDAVCLDISGNTSAGSNGASGIGLRKQGNVAATNDFGLQGIGIVSPTNVQVQTYVNTQNPAGGGTDIINGNHFVDCSGAP